MILTLIRHGQTDFGYQRRYCGSSDVPLNDDGQNQCEKLLERFKGSAVDTVYSSGLKRADQTAQIVFKEKKAIEQPCFREMAFGIIEGLNYEEAVHQYADVYKAWIKDPWSVPLPQAESFQDFHTRVTQGLKVLLARHEDKSSIALVSHSGPIRVILCEALGRSFKDFWTIQQDNAAVNIIEYHPSQRPKVIVINDTEHLKVLQKANL